MNGEQPLVTVALATYNSGRTIERCLQAINAQIYPNIEIIVVDALNYKSEEQQKCKTIIERYAQYLQDGPERSFQRNRGIREAKGEYVLVLDQDMYCEPNVVTECVAIMQSGKHIALNIPEISIGDGFWTRCVVLDRYVTVYLEKGMNECCRFFRKQDAEAVGGYDPAIVGAEDSDFHYRMSTRGAIGKIQAHALHDEGRTRFWGRVRKKYYYSTAFREYLKRRPGIAVRQFFPLRTAYVKHWRVLVQQPFVTLGMIALRAAETVAGAWGLLVKR